MRKAKRKTAPQEGPTAERLQRGDVEAMSRAIADEDGRVSRPYRVVDTLGMMLRKGTITPAMRQAADDFHALFVVASLETLHAVDLLRAPQPFRELPPSLRQAEARKKVWAALKALGGGASPAGSCVWHVVGCEWSLKQWALRTGWGGRPLSQEAASGVLVGALGVLQAHYGL